MVQVATSDVQPVCDHPAALNERERKRLARARYNRSARQKLRRKLREAGISKLEMDLMIRAEFGVRARPMNHNEVRQ